MWMRAGGRSFWKNFPLLSPAFFFFFFGLQGKRERQAASLQLWFTNIISGPRNQTRLHFWRVLRPALLCSSGPSFPWSRWSQACCDGACLNTAEINTSSVGRCSLPAGGAAAGIVTAAACFAALAPTAGRSNTILTSLLRSFTPSVLSVKLYLIFHLLLTDTDVCHSPWSNYRTSAK